MSDIIVFYHSSCDDGFCSALVAHSVLGDENVEYIPLSYSQPLSDVTDKTVYFLDFACKLPQMRECIQKAKQVYLLDHHKTAIEDYDTFEHPKLTKILDNNHSGAYITWRHFNWFNTFIPWVVLYVEDRDLWKFKLIDSKNINNYISSLPKNFGAWQHLLNKDHQIYDINNLEGIYATIPGYAKMIGSAITIYKDSLINNILEKKYYIKHNDLLIPTVNTSLLQSEIAGKLSENAPFGIAWFKRADGLIQVSLRSNNKNNPGTDVAKIAKMYGGGGHFAASGAELTEEEFARDFEPV